MGEVDLSGLKQRIPRLPLWIWTGLSFLLPFLYCLYYGRIGFNPLDSPIVFDGGYRILQGQGYLIDFFAPAGYIPSLIQSFFFRIFGINWFSFCLHAALFNGLFALVVFKLLRRLKAPYLLAFLYALLSGLVFYAPFGSPYPEQHSFFFSLLAIYGLVAGDMRPGKLASRLQKIAWLSVGPAFLAAFLSKPVPAGYAIVLAGLLLPFLIPRPHWKQALLFISLGTFAGLLLIALLLSAWNLNYSQAWYFFWELPAQTGMDRIAQAATGPTPAPNSVFTAPFKVFASYNDPYIIFCYGIPGIFMLTGFLNLLRSRLGNRRSGQWLDRGWLRMFPFPPFQLLLILALGIGLTVVSSLFVRFTQNQPENGIPFIFLHLGLVHLFLVRYFVQAGDSHPDRIRIWRGVVWSISIVLAFFMGRDSIGFHRETIVQRKVHDFPAMQKIEYAGPAGIVNMDWLLWQEPWRYGDRQMDSLASYLRSADTPFFYFGNMTFLYGLMRQENPLPSLWLHEGLTIPRRDSKWLGVFEDQLLRNLEALDPGIYIAENAEGETYTGLKLSAFPKVKEWIDWKKGEEYRIGSYHLWNLKE